MATPVQITVTVDSNGAVTGFSQVGGAAKTMGQEVSTSGLKGAAAVEALTKQWNAEQAAIAAVNARIKENMAARAAQSDAGEKARRAAEAAANEDAAFRAKAFADSARAYDQLGLSNRALNQVAARSALLGRVVRCFERLLQAYSQCS